MQTVAQLIEKLQQLDPALPVLVEGYEGGYTTFSISEQEVFYSPSDYCGEYDKTEWRINHDNQPPFMAILLERGPDPSQPATTAD